MKTETTIRRKLNTGKGVIVSHVETFSPVLKNEVRGFAIHNWHYGTITSEESFDAEEVTDDILAQFEQATIAEHVRYIQKVSATLKKWHEKLN